jgi:5-methyltetrahydropteroyltriglutamate--homocysteine methyltransferase
MKTEYEAIVDAGFQLQIDAPDLAMGRHIMYRDQRDEEFVAAAARHVQAINRAVRDLPGNRVRLHVCWGNDEGPHHLDIGLERIIDVVLHAKPATILFEAANPRHEHEWVVWRDAEISEDKVLAPGVIDSTCNYIEHPELVAQRIETFVEIVGPERVIGGTDCGFRTWSGFGSVDPDICWAKLQALAEGARIAGART